MEQQKTDLTSIGETIARLAAEAAGPRILDAGAADLLAPLLVAVRLRYRKVGGDVRFVLRMHEPRVAFREAVDEAIEFAREQTGLPLLRGALDLPAI